MDIRGIMSVSGNDTDTSDTRNSLTARIGKWKLILLKRGREMTLKHMRWTMRFLVILNEVKSRYAVDNQMK